jgi:hypothetical protein
VDSAKDLAAFVQSFPQSGEEPPSPPATEPPPEPAPVTPVQVSPPADREAELLAERERVKQLQAELDREKREREQEATTRRVLAEQQPPRPPVPPPPAPPPREDPRLQQIDDLWFSDPPKARALLRQVQQEETQRTIQEERGKIKQEVFGELDARTQRQQGTDAYQSAITYLRGQGVPEEQINVDRITSVYTVITRKPTPQSPNPYYTAGGPTNANVIVGAWRDLFGLPGNQTYTPPPAPVPATPPGSGRPAPAAAPPRGDRAAPLSADMKRDIEHMAETFNLDKDKLMARRRARIAQEK